jgi:hypothetical protein
VLEKINDDNIIKDFIPKNIKRMMLLNIMRLGDELVQFLIIPIAMSEIMKYIYIINV